MSSNAGTRHTGQASFVSTPIGTAHLVPLDFFIEHVLPPLRYGLDLDVLIDKGRFKHVVTMQGKLWGYKTKTPSGIHSRDMNRAFAHLQQAIHTTVKSVHGFRSTLVFHHNEQEESNYKARNNDSLPDAHFIPCLTPADAVPWTELAVPGEYKIERTTETIEENIQKISETMLNCMRRDPRRRFVYGFTAEDAFMKLWYCDRSQVVVSHDFSFTENCRTLLYFVLSVSFAELHELGWDPTMTPTLRDDAIQYDVTVRQSDKEVAVYRTLGVLYDRGVQHLMGRGTRVWKAVKVVDGDEIGKPVALKDAWVDSTREREGSVNARVRQSMSQLEGVSGSDDYLLTVESHGDVFVAGTRDRTPYFSDRAPSIQRTTSHTDEDRPCVQVHYRIVFKEVGTPLSEVTSLRAAFRALSDAVQGINALHKSGWVHRDLSTGNILIVGSKGKLTDVEYATKMDEQKETGRTGTADFISVEVRSQSYLFLPAPELIDLSALVEEMKAGGRELNEANLPQFHPPDDYVPRHKFRHNPLHDLESLWWIAVYLIVNREADLEGSHVGEKKHEAQPIASQRKFSRELFLSESHRLSAMSSSDYFRRRLSSLHPALFEIGCLLEEARIHLYQTYFEAEKAVELIDSNVAAQLYPEFLQSFKAAAEHLKIDVRIRRFSEY